MPKEMKELIEKRKSPSDQLKDAWKEINDKLKGSGIWGSFLFNFSKSLERAGIDNHKFERARETYEKAEGDLVYALRDIRKNLD